MLLSRRNSRTSNALTLLVISALVGPLLLILVVGSHPSSAFETSDPIESDFHEDEGHGHDGTHSGSVAAPLPKDKILLRELKQLTFIRNKRTTSRRTHSIHQLSCVGGTAGCKLFTPDVVECHNGGVDKATGKQQWQCRAEMSERVKFNHVEVICEGYDYPEDDYILLGSCGLEFTLDYVDPHDYHDQSYFKHMDDHEKELHHERVRSQQDQVEPREQQQKLITQVLIFVGSKLGSYILVSVILLLVILMALVRYFTGSASGGGADSPSLLGSAGGRKRNTIAGNGGRTGGYGPLTSAVMATKKAC